MATLQQQKDFVKTVYPAAERLHEKGGIHPMFVTAQAALETGWKIQGIENNIFGITVGTSWTGKKKLVRTFEFFNTPNKTFKLPEQAISVTPVGTGKYKYEVMRYFRVYDSIDDCLNDHLAQLRKPMYADAWPYRNDPCEYARRIVNGVGAKYATAPNYAATMASMIGMVERHVKALGL